MVKQNRTSIPHEIDKPLPHRASTRQSLNNQQLTDDLIITLANAYENERARQVVEWERTQPVYIRQLV